MSLVVFDVDGTLTQSMEIDSACFVQSLEDVFGFSDVDADWSHYRQASDSGILHELCESRRGRPPLADKIQRCRQHFVNLLREAVTATSVRTVPGAAQLLGTLAGKSDYTVALATGGWSDSARLKMNSAGMQYDDYPSASADDATDREVIIGLAVERAVGRRQTLRDVVYVGDGVWDARACRKLGVPFIGIGAGQQAEKLFEEGAVHVFSDLSDQDALLRCVSQACVSTRNREV